MSNPHSGARGARRGSWVHHHKDQRQGSRTMIRNLIRAAAALPLGAFALTVLPFGAAHAAQNDQAEWTITGECSGSDFIWLVKIDNTGAAPIWASFTSDDGQHRAANVDPSAHYELVLYGIEGMGNTVHLSFDSVEVDSESVAMVDCITGEDPHAAITLVCPEPGSDQDIFVDYLVGVQGGSAQFKLLTPDSTEQVVTKNSADEHLTYKVEEGQAIDVWVKLNTNGQTLATLNTTVDCTADQPVVDTPEQTTGVAGDFPHTGVGSDLAWIAAGLTAVGAGAVRASRRKVAIAE